MIGNVTKDTKNLRISEVFAFVSRDENGDEGVMGAILPIDGVSVMTALIGADWERVKQLYPIAKRTAEEFNTEFKLLKFSVREDVTDKLN